ncbi:MAG: type 4b pilus protein PilO2 [Vicinamibacterales bacterium]
MLLTIGSKRFAFGVEWSMAMNRAEGRAQAKEAGKGPVAYLPGDDGQFFVGHYGHEKVRGKRVFAAAAALALVVPDAIICQDLSDDTAWICVLQGGKPIPHQEELCSRDEARAKVRDLMSMHRHPYYGDQAGATSDIEELVRRLEDALAKKQLAKKDLSACELRPQGISPQLVLGVGGFVIVSAAVAVGFQHWKKTQQQQASSNANLAKARQAMMTAEELERQRKLLLAQFNANVAAKRAELAADQLSGRVLAHFQWADGLRKLPVSRDGGWVPASVKCMPLECATTWEARGRYTLASTKSAITGDTTPDGATTAVTKMVLPANPGQPVNVSFDPPAFRLFLAESLARVPGATVDMPQPVVVSPPQGLNVPPVTVGHTGAIRFASQAGTGLLSAYRLSQILDRYPIRVNSVEFSGIRAGLSVAIDVTYVLMEPQ